MKEKKKKDENKRRSLCHTHLEVNVLHVLHVEAHSSPGGGKVAIQLPAIVLNATISKAKPWVHFPSSGSEHGTLNIVVVLIVGEVVQDVAI